MSVYLIYVPSAIGLTLLPRSRSAPGPAGSWSSAPGSRTAATRDSQAATALGASVADTTLGGYSLIRAR